MSKRNKLQKFQDLLELDFVFENFDPSSDSLLQSETEEVTMAGNWKAKHFKNENPIVLELACGRGEYAIGLAKMYPSKNFIGSDIKGARIWTGARKVIEEKLKNVAFLRTRIEFIELFFGKEEIDEIWITFADPFIKSKKSNRRLTSDYFLDKYSSILKKGGLLHVKTDSPILYYHSLDHIASRNDFKLLYHEDHIYNAPFIPEELKLKTYYELEHLGNNKTIKYIQAIRT